MKVPWALLVLPWRCERHLLQLGHGLTANTGSTRRTKGDKTGGIFLILWMQCIT